MIWIIFFSPLLSSVSWWNFENINFFFSFWLLMLKYDESDKQMHLELFDIQREREKTVPKTNGEKLIKLVYLSFAFCQSPWSVVISLKSISVDHMSMDAYLWREKKNCNAMRWNGPRYHNLVISPMNFASNDKQKQCIDMRRTLDLSIFTVKHWSDTWFTPIASSSLWKPTAITTKIAYF